MFHGKILWLTVYILFGVIFTYCKSNKKEVITSSEVEYEDQGTFKINDLQKKIWFEGDTVAYDDLMIAYLNKPPRDMLFWNLYMAHKYDYMCAYYDVFFTLQQIYNIVDDAPLDKMDKKTRIMALKYLKISAERGHPEGKRIFDKYCMDGVYVTKEGEIIDGDDWLD